MSKALYYPFARCTNDSTLKRAILLFDEVGFLDPFPPDIRESLITDDREVPEGIMRDWSVLSDTYGMLLEREIVKLYDPRPIVEEHDLLLTAALRSDLDDKQFWKSCRLEHDEYFRSRSEAGLPTTWSMLRERIPESARQSGIAQSDGYLRLGPGNHDDHTVVSYDVPYVNGSILNVNTALLVADNSDLVPFTDSFFHHNLLVRHFERGTSRSPQNEALFGVAKLNPEKVRRIAFTMLDVLVPDERIKQLSISDCVKYREASRDAFDRLKLYINELVVSVEAEPWSEKFERELQQIVHKKIIPEARKAKDAGIDVYDQLFGKIAAKAVGALTPTLGVSIFAGLTLPAMLAVGTAAALGSIFPDVLGAYLEERANRRSSLAYLIEFPR